MASAAYDQLGAMAADGVEKDCTRPSATDTVDRTVDPPADGGDPPRTRRLAARDLGLRFRGSDLTDDQIVVEVRLDLRRGDRDTSERQIAEIVRWRREHQPGGQNCGSVFVNPVPGEVTAGGLIDSLGLRGLRIGTASVSEKHANFIQASDGGSATDVRAVMETVRDRVAAATGFVMRSEVRLVGFDDAPESFDETRGSR